MKDLKDKIGKMLKDRGITDVKTALEALEKLAPLAEIMNVILANDAKKNDRSWDAADNIPPQVVRPAKTTNDRLCRDLSIILNAYQSNSDWLDQLEECRSDTERAVILEGLRKNTDAIGMAVIRHLPG